MRIYRANLVISKALTINYASFCHNVFAVILDVFVKEINFLSKIISICLHSMKNQHPDFPHVLLKEPQTGRVLPQKVPPLDCKPHFFLYWWKRERTKQQGRECRGGSEAAELRSLVASPVSSVSNMWIVEAQRLLANDKSLRKGANRGTCRPFSVRKPLTEDAFIDADPKVVGESLNKLLF